MNENELNESPPDMESNSQPADETIEEEECPLGYHWDNNRKQCVPDEAES